jgi:hypothetical protein
MKEGEMREYGGERVEEERVGREKERRKYIRIREVVKGREKENRKEGKGYSESREEGDKG